MGGCLALFNILFLVPAEDRPFSFFFRDALLTVREQAVAPVVPAPLPDSEESSVWVSDSDDSSAVDPDHPEFGVTWRFSVSLPPPPP